MSDHADNPLDPADYLTLLEPLFLLEPEFADQLFRDLVAKSPLPAPAEVRILVENSLFWMRDYPELGKAVATGFLQLAGVVSENWQEQYADTVAVGKGITPVIGRSVAEKFVSIIQIQNESLLQLAREVVATIGPWGPYPLGQVMNALLSLLEAGEENAAQAYLQMILAALGQQISERELIRYAPLLSRGILFCPPEKRDWQVVQLLMVVKKSYGLAHAFFRGMEKGLAHLSGDDLPLFIAKALHFADEKRQSRFLALESLLGLDACRELQTMVPLSAVVGSLSRYLQARSGRSATVRSLEHLPATSRFMSGPCTDGFHIYLPGEMDRGKTVVENQLIYRMLAGLDLACWEAGSFDFDWQRFREEFCPAEMIEKVGVVETSGVKPQDDLERFFAGFSHPVLAEELLNLIEQGRVICFLKSCYPGFVKQVRLLLDKELQRLVAVSGSWSFWQSLYALLILDREPETDSVGTEPWFEVLMEVRRGFNEDLTETSPVEVAALLVCKFYPLVAAIPSLTTKEVNPLDYPFGRRLRFDLVARASRKQEEGAIKLKAVLEDAGIDFFKADLKRLLKEHDQSLTPEMLKNCLFTLGGERGISGKKLRSQLSGLDLQQCFPAGQDGGASSLIDEKVPTYWYDEWSIQLQDYLRDHVKLLEHQRVGSDSSFYPEVLVDHGGLVRRIRRNFELLRPEGLQILRHWPEGDSFDYDALIEYAIDRRLKITPDERFYRKRLKVDRDVAVFLLIDVSSSTKNKLPDSSKTILGVEKEAVVLFCEALERVGDSFSIAGFSGSGRLAAEFFLVKDFAESLNDEVKNRIGALRPEKNTRMGPAVRHATTKLAAYPAKVKLLVILSDGLPNDQDYSQEYAIEDCRAAIRESRSKFVHVHAITVNAANSPHLDRLYGDVHHSVIADVKDLPDKLPRIYRALTKQ
ncbi:MAG TPA: VWA domain-containing protein [Proteobacteria bacterium]|nr:VWA domain-containing protein [Pseudomonadota bacterium]